MVRHDSRRLLLAQPSTHLGAALALFAKLKIHAHTVRHMSPHHSCAGKHEPTSMDVNNLLRDVYLLNMLAPGYMARFRLDSSTSSLGPASRDCGTRSVSIFGMGGNHFLSRDSAQRVRPLVLPTITYCACIHAWCCCQLVSERLTAVFGRRDRTRFDACNGAVLL